MLKEIKVCMGSACFAKGNQENLEYLKQYIDEKGLNTDVTILGSLCENKCDAGPRIIADGVEYTNVTKEKITELLEG